MTKWIFIKSFVQYFKNVHLPRTIHNMQYIYRGKTIVYAIVCTVDNMVYVGSTMVPGRRFHNHLVTGDYSNDALQAAISQHGLDKFNVYILEVVPLSSNLTLSQMLKMLHRKEQQHMNMFPKAQLYNSIASSRN